MPKKTGISELKSHIGYRLRVVSNAVSHSFARKLADCEVTVAEWVILREMYSSDDKTNPSKVAEITGLSRGAVSKLIDRLLVKEFVLRFESPQDRRYQEIALTTKALELVPQLADLANENDEHFFSALTELERKTFMDALVKLAEFHKFHDNPIK